jgi:hypothetical protein
MQKDQKMLYLGRFNTSRKKQWGRNSTRAICQTSLPGNLRVFSAVVCASLMQVMLQKETV